MDTSLSIEENDFIRQLCSTSVKDNKTSNGGSTLC